ncbi:hypothetical protein DBY65_023210 [Pseudomonas sp. RIT412]|nr:hypothetical protein DBP26_019575 [Pseudomonas sp. RIT 409]RAU50059.1 hypothetical protein DBY65_023210 [Pseudomonas sp. RIT 412]
MSTLSEIAANLMKRERMAEAANESRVASQGMGWQALMALSQEKDIHRWQAALNQMIAQNPGKQRVTVLRVIEGGLS